jgi:Flp pilus assembly protein TadG
MHLNLNRVTAAAKSFLQQIVRARRGNMALIFAIVLVPVLITGGAGIDLARAMAVRTKLYAAVDAAALAVASKNGITQTQAQVLAQQYFNANYKLNTSFGTPAAVTVNIVGQSVTVSTQNNMPTTLMGIAGFQHVNLNASSNVVWGQTKIWVGLALDNTGSMCQSASNTSISSCPTPSTDSKIAALKTATHALIGKFQSVAANPGDVQVSLMPFARDVKVDATANASATWIDWSAWDETRGSCTLNGQSVSYSTKTTCEAATSGTCSAGSSYTSQSACSGAGTCSLSGNTTQSACQSAGTCSVNGYTSQSSCNSAGTCNISSYTSQNSCTSNRAYMCSLSAYTTENSCESAGTCSIAGRTNESSCEAYSGYVCKINGVNYTDAAHDTQTECTATANGVCSRTAYTTRTTCRNASPAGTWYTGTWTGVGQGVWTAGEWSRQYGTWTATPGNWTAASWTATPGAWTPTNGVWTPNRSGWTGCIADRGDWTAPSNPAYDTMNTTPNTAAASKFPAADTDGCPTATVMGLSSDWTALNSKVDTMTASGNTNQTIGMAWAWQSLTQGAPFSPPALPTNTTRYIIILSDGENTQNRWSSSRTTIDGRMSALCTNAKADGVIIWTVFVNIANTAGNADSMKNCATGGEFGGRYISVTSTGDIGTAFDVISQQITNLRVAH